MMLDYEAIAALAAVIETQSFQLAADRLFVTQSAISQRIKSLEQYYGEPVLIRAHPYQPTQLGLNLLGHYKRVVLLEDALQFTLNETNIAPRIALSISRDSLETWFVTVLDQVKQLMPITLDIIADDQEYTLSYLQKGIVSACASTTKKPLSGCKSEFLGFFDYVLVCSPEFKQKYFKNTHQHKKNLTEAPFAMFDQNDKLHLEYLKHFFGIEEVNLKHVHVIPSVDGFKQFAVKGYAYAMIPEIDITHELQTKKLINLYPDKVWEMPVYWHAWEIETKAYQLFNQLVSKIGRQLLRQK